MLGALNAVRRRRILASLPPLVFDDFERADSTTVLGDAVTGQTWQAVAGVYGITSGDAYNVSGSNLTAAVVDAGVANGDIISNIKLSGVAASVGVTLRWGDVNNLLFARLVRTTGTDAVELWSRIGSVYTKIGNLAGAGLVAGQTYKMRVRLRGDFVSVFVDDALKIAHTLDAATYAAIGENTQHGLMLYRASGNDNGASQWNDFSLEV